MPLSSLVTNAVNGVKDKAKETLSEFLSGESPDSRCILAPRDKTNSEVVDRIFGKDDDSSPMYPLRKSKRLLFPNTPSIQFGGTAEYEDFGFAHTNYKSNSYVKSYPSEIMLTAEFTATTPFEAKYMLAVIHFCRSVTKMEFGVKAGDNAGTPPPVLNFSYLGKHMFNKVPVVMKNFQMSFDTEVDYVDVPFFKTRVPSYTTITMTLEPYYNPREMRNEFHLDDFKTGKLINRGYI
jgi:hypothetical protein